MRRHGVRGELVTFKNAKQFHHDGILYEAGRGTTIIHVHGSYGNFYQNEFLRVMARTYSDAGLAFLAFNLRAHDALAEGYRHEWDFEYTGGAISPFDDCVDDIQGAVDFVSPFSERIILQGHSMGCDRVLHYMLTTGSTCDMVLLSPCDSYQLQARWIAPEAVEQQIDRLERMTADGTECEWLPLGEYGIRQGDWNYPIPITRRNLLAVLTGAPFQLLRLDKPSGFYIDNNALIYIGGDDTLQTSPREVMVDYFRRRCRTVREVQLHPEGDHSLWGCEQEVSDEIVAWAQTILGYQPRT